MKRQWNEPKIDILEIKNTEKDTYIGVNIDLWEPTPEGDHDNIWYAS